MNNVQKNNNFIYNIEIILSFSSFRDKD